MKTFFGKTPQGEDAYLYTISCGQLQAEISDFGATLVKLFVPDSNGNMADVVLGFDSPADYAASDTYFGATVGRNANRVKNACFILNNKTYSLSANEFSCTVRFPLIIRIPTFPCLTRIPPKSASSPMWTS